MQTICLQLQAVGSCDDNIQNLPAAVQSSMSACRCARAYAVVNPAFTAKPQTLLLLGLRIKCECTALQCHALFCMLADLHPTLATAG